MRKVVAYQLLSLDGVAERPEGFFLDWDEVMDENLGRVISTQDAVLLGRRTYDEWCEYWPPSEIEPFATFINGVQKFVATSSAPTLPWANTAIIETGFSEFVADLKEQPGGDIGLHGSIELTQSLLEEDLVDELRLVIAPALHMHGRKLFERGVSRRVTLTRHVASPTGYLLLDYHVGA